jgi:Spy/CpxP family protein refolding chaperone
MKKTTKWTMTAMALLFGAAIATSAFGFGWGRGPGFGYGPCGGDFGRYAGIELTSEQKAQLTAMRDARIKEMEPLRDQMFAKRDVLKKLWLEPNPDQVKILAAQKEMRALRDQLQDRMTAFRLDALKVFTPEQRQRISSAISGRGAGPGRHRGPGAGSGGAGCFGGGPGARGNW